MKNNHQSGFVIPLTLMLIAVAMVLITSIYQKGSIFVPFISTMMQREQAKMLALSGVQVAMSQLATASEAKDEKKKDTETPPAARTMLRSGSINRFRHCRLPFPKRQPGKFAPGRGYDDGCNPCGNETG